MGDILNVLFAVVALFAVYAAVRAYGTAWKPKKGDCLSWIAHGICIGFIAIGASALYWGILYRGLRVGGMAEAAAWVHHLGAYANVLFMGVSPVWAAFAHLKAKHLSLSARDQREWSILEMIYHPARKAMLRNLFRRNKPTVGRRDQR